MSSARAESTEWTIPLTVSVSLGPPELRAAQPPERGAAIAAAAMVSREAFVTRERAEADVFAIASRRFRADALAAADFRWQTALATALCSSLAYQHANEISALATGDWALATCDCITVGSTACFVASTDSAIVVAFRGTQAIADWLINLNTLFTTVEYGSVHRGFYQAFQSVRPELEQVLGRLGTQRRQIVLTGHSLGGALATIAAAEWRSRFPVSSIYTYGQPAVGLTNFRSNLQLHYPDTFYRFVNGNDIVPQVPPGYRHVGRLYQFDRRGRVTGESLTRMAAFAPAADTPTLSDAEFQRLKAELQAARDAAPIAMNENLHANLVQERFFPSVADHSMDRYLAQVLGQLD